jgi:hypothetical protein
MRNLAVLPIALAVIGLAACTAEARPTVSGEDLADLAADALEEETGARPDMDCGTDSIIITEDKEVDCTATSTQSGTEYDAVVTFTDVDGTDYRIGVEVASEPNGAESEAPASDPAEEDTSQSGTDEAWGGEGDTAWVRVTAEQFAAAVADALVEELGSRPEIYCGEGTTRTLMAGAIHSCELVDAAAGERYNITITIESIVDGQFNFTAELADTPN